MTSLHCTILGPPVGKGRPRVTTRGGFAQAYTPPKTARWEGLACAVMQSLWRGPPIETACSLVVRAVGVRPKSLMRKRDAEGRFYRTARPDGDNILKAAADALVKAGVIRDDALIVEWRCTSLYAAKIEAACVEIELEEI